MKKVLILTDSLGLPREDPETCFYEQTWPALLRSDNLIISQVSIGGATSTDLVRQAHYHKAFMPDVVIVQVGIVDCAPRFMTRKEQAIIRAIPFFGNKIFTLLNTPVVKKFRKITYTDPRIFQKNILEIQKYFKDKTICFVGILPADEAYESLLPGINRRVKEYNKILSENSALLDMSDFSLNGIMSDRHHLNAIGHYEIYKKLVNAYF